MVDRTHKNGRWLIEPIIMVEKWWCWGWSNNYWVCHIRIMLASLAITQTLIFDGPRLINQMDPKGPKNLTHNRNIYCIYTVYIYIESISRQETVSPSTSVTLALVTTSMPCFSKVSAAATCKPGPKDGSRAAPRCSSRIPKLRGFIARVWWAEIRTSEFKQCGWTNDNANIC